MIDTSRDRIAMAESKGKTISDMEVRGKGGFLVVALRKLDSTTIIHPQHEMLLEAGDTVILMGHRGDIPQFAQKYVLKRDIRYRGAKMSSVIQ